MSTFETAFATEAYRGRNEDRVVVLQSDIRLIVAVVDGAGGLGSGDIAAETVIQEIRNEYSHIHSAKEWSEFLTQVDCRLSVGQAAAVVLDVRSYGIAGASVGDCQAWIVNGDTIADLTEKQIRKPLLGSGTAQPTWFTCAKLEGIMLVGSDGLFSYAKREQLLQVVTLTDFFTLSRACVDMVRLPSGEFWDDVTVAAIRTRPRVRTRRSYSI